MHGRPTATRSLKTLIRSRNFPSPCTAPSMVALSLEMKTFFKFLYDNIPQISMEAYTKQAFANVTIIRHNAKSNESKMMMLGCKECNKMTDPLYFASNHLDCQQIALNVLHDFFRPYCREVQCSGSRNKAPGALCRKQYWQLYWQQHCKQCQIHPALTSSTGSTAASSTPRSQADSDATSSTQRPRFMDWDPVTIAGRTKTYKCIVNECRFSRSVIEPPPSDEETS